MATDPDVAERALIQRVIARLVTDIANPPDLAELAKEASLPPYQLSSIFGRILGKSIPSVLRAKRMEIAATLLLETDLQVGAFAAKVGYNNLRAFHQAFTLEIGLGPLTYRQGNPRRA
ncbi:AraC-like DNA-binding protein [Roseimicrobium gellanilyticum]|uniref:AraC-like DNA-binding protein n=1 Tax=Roseimicrobium gellanilyticum TaxID=748857 RepID=A0A366HAL1_9BACT|nr:AraC family transcriptional regulator [Roseimicrobium gellanilyticum]RBP38187.1 AraC-like DNA-binding protein [Roseimicrobium gellanilyticum]